MIESTTYRCDRCGKSFWYRPDSVTHDNYTSEWNLNALYNRGDFIRDLDLRNDNYCNVKDIETKTMRDIIACKLLWLEKKDKTLYNEAQRYLANREGILNRILGKYSEAYKHLTTYWAEANKIIDALEEYKHVVISRVHTLNPHVDVYLATVEDGSVFVLDTMEE